MRRSPRSAYRFLVIGCIRCRFIHFCDERIYVARLCIITGYGSSAYSKSGNLHILQKSITALIPVCRIRMGQGTAAIHIVDDLTTCHVDSDPSCHSCAQSATKHVIDGSTRHRDGQRMLCICIRVCRLITTTIDVANGVCRFVQLIQVGICAVYVDRHLTLRSTIQVITTKNPGCLTASCGHSDITIDFCFNR